MSEKPSGVTIRVYDGPAIAHIPQPGQSVRTIGDYIERLIIPYARNEASGSLQRMDWLWDVYPEACLKRQAHLNRGDGIAKKVTDATPINTKEWSSMLNNEETKKELYSFISLRS